MIVRKIARWLLVALVVVAAVAVGALAAFRVAAALRETDVAADVAPKSGRLVPTAAGAIFIKEAGPPGGLPVLLFHGTAGWSELWAATQEALAAAGFHSIAFDIPPFGFSGKAADGNYDRTAQAKRVVALLDALGIGRVILLGHSYGAGPAVETLMRSPDRVAGMVLLDAAIGLDPAADSAPPALLNSPFLREVAISATATNPFAMRWLLSTLLAKKEAATAAVADLLFEPMTIQGTTPAIDAWALTFMGPESAALSSHTANYAKVAVPTVVVWGEADTVTPLAAGSALAAAIPGARLEIIPGLGHIPHLEDPALAIPVIVRAVESVAAGVRPAA